VAIHRGFLLPTNKTTGGTPGYRLAAALLSL